jgi:hypothetical protein
MVAPGQSNFLLKNCHGCESGAGRKNGAPTRDRLFIGIDAIRQTPGTAFEEGHNLFDANAIQALKKSSL